MLTPKVTWSLGLPPHSDKQCEQADDDCHADQKAEIVLTTGVMHFIHVDIGIEEGEDKRYGRDNAMP